MPKRPAVVLFRRDLRLSDNPALADAAASGAPLIFLYVLDDGQAFAPGGAARWWLHESLKSLDASLRTAGAALTLRRGGTSESLHALIAETGASSVYWSRRYAPAEVAYDTALKQSLKAAGIDVRSASASLLREPWETLSSSGRPFSVFTPFWKALLAAGPSRPAPLPAPGALHAAQGVASEALSDWRLQPTAPNWAAEFPKIWRPGEESAHVTLQDFIAAGAARYSTRRDYPAEDTTSRLSPHLAFGEISPLQIWSEIDRAEHAGRISAADAQKFLSEIAWREFAYTQLFNAPDITSHPIRPSFAQFPYRTDAAQFQAWAMGRTGYPIVDAGMRQLRRTGWMHNRVRMIAASFLTKHLLQPWRDGAAWFFDELVDADPASNAASWQWVAGCGADAAPYFRIFNPTLQGEKFDPNGDYVRKFVPELKKLPNAYLHRPWEAPPAALDAAGVALGRTYPLPMIDHAEARARALAAMQSMKANHDELTA